MMEKKGLCTTCVEFSACIFVKEPPVWQCEEFSSGGVTAENSRQTKAKKIISSRENTEAE